MRAKLFRNGRSQAVRLPASCRFEGTEDEVERDPRTGVVSLRPLRSTPLEWLRQRAALLDEDPQASADGFASLVQRDDLSGPAQER
ncbi:antitoxin, partial [Vulcanococcus sp.]|uniref:antitoxin n=1 Tax=Vulcanococcus sp. TaxID=2856995 RepID=UPI003C05346A